MSDLFIDVFFKVLKIREPDYNLGVGSGSHGEMTGRTMIAFEQVVMKEKPDVILVYGDTDTTVAGALVGAKLKIPVAHVEAGIRQEPHNMPEEINRKVTDHVSDLLFAPSQLAVENLAREGVTKGVYYEFGFGHGLQGVDVIQPLDYLKLMRLVMHSAFVITDSGGLQKEAYFCAKRALVVMPDTGWRELVEVGWNVLVYPVNDTFNVLWESLSQRT